MCWFGWWGEAEDKEDDDDAAAAAVVGIDASFPIVSMASTVTFLFLFYTSTLLVFSHKE
jgi:hypothetical protein